LAAKRKEERGIAKAITSTLKEWRLVLMRVKRPDKDEFIQALKVVFLGLAIVGAMAYIIHVSAILLMRPPG